MSRSVARSPTKATKDRWQRTAGAPVTPTTGWDRRCGTGVALLLTILFIALARRVDHSDRILYVDGAILQALRAHANSDLIRALHSIHILGSNAVYLILPLAAWLLLQRRLQAVVLVLASEASLFLVYRWLKGVIQRARPGDAPPPTDVSSYLFPSGHTVAAVVTVGLLTWFLGQRLRGWSLGLLVTGMTTLVAAYCLSLIYFNYHYATDVLGGLLLGGIWLIMTIGMLHSQEALVDERPAADHSPPAGDVPESRDMR